MRDYRVLGIGETMKGRAEKRLLGIRDWGRKQRREVRRDSLGLFDLGCSIGFSLLSLPTSSGQASRSTLTTADTISIKYAGLQIFFSLTSSLATHSRREKWRHLQDAILEPAPLPWHLLFKTLSSFFLWI